MDPRLKKIARTFQKSALTCVLDDALVRMQGRFRYSDR